MEGHVSYRRPGWIDRNVFNRIVAGFTRIGISFWGSRVLEVRGRTSGEPRRTPVNMLSVEGKQYLVAPRGQTQWVRNLRAAGEGTLLLGRRRERFRAAELADGEKGPIIREYLRRWKWEVGQFFDGVGPESEPGELARIAPDHPVFRIIREGSGSSARPAR
jgi:deazaflavin-dependent oxidoreductase (nitroreductase family)